MEPLQAVYWVTECIPLPVTALLPVVLLPLLKIMTTEEVCITYLKESNMMFIGNQQPAECKCWVTVTDPPVLQVP